MPALTPEQEALRQAALYTDAEFERLATHETILALLAQLEAIPSVPTQTGFDLIAQIVDRDTPPDNRNEVIDCDIRGKPITRGDVAAFSREPGG